MNVRRKMLSICLIVIMIAAMSVNAFAVTEQSWGPHWYTPYTANVAAKDNMVTGTNMKWTVNQISLFTSSQAWELEFHPYEKGVEPKEKMSPSMVWMQKGSLSTNLPDAYYEFDTDDTSLATKAPDTLVAERSYYATQSLTRRTLPAYPTPQFAIESEVGEFIIYDAVPQYLEYYTWYGFINNTYNW